MSRKNGRAAGLPRLLAALLILMASPRAAAAQRVEVTPFGGYRFGGGIFDTVAGMPVGADGGTAFGGVVDYFVDGSQSVMFLYSHQHVHADVASESGPVRATLLMEHWHVGGAQELGDGVVRPLIDASLGLSRFGTSGHSEVRFSFAGGGGVKLMPSRHVGVRLDGRAYGVVVNGTVVVGCVSGLCSTRINAFVTWQLEFTAGAVVAF